MIKEHHKRHMIAHINAITDEHHRAAWVIANTLELAVLMRVCYGWDTAIGVKWNYLVDYAGKICKAKREHGDRWKQSLMPEINELSPDNKKIVIDVLKLLTNPENEIKVTEKNGE